MEPKRRLSDRIIAAHELACQEGNLEVAEILLRALEVDLSAIGGDMEEHRNYTEMLESAFDRHEEAKSKHPSGGG